jgi:hypothetical protein
MHIDWRLRRSNESLLDDFGLIDMILFSAGFYPHALRLINLEVVKFVQHSIADHYQKYDDFGDKSIDKFLSSPILHDITMILPNVSFLLRQKLALFWSIAYPMVFKDILAKIFPLELNNVSYFFGKILDSVVSETLPFDTKDSSMHALWSLIRGLH